MRITRLLTAGWLSHASFAALALALASLVLLPACSIHVKKDESGQDKNVDINTPFGGIHVDKNADARDTGIPVYPGARIKQKGTSDDDKNANVDISGMGYGLKVVAVEYESDSTPKTVIAYYKEQLKKYGNVLECHTASPNASMKYHSDSDSMSKELTCGPDTGSNIELKAGINSNQHIVSIKPEGTGSEFALVYVRTYGKDTI
jgi:hypothetical protein